MARKSGLWSELKRRSVFKVAGVYVGAAFAVLQGVDLAVEPLHLPTWTMALLWVLVLAGLPLALVLAWAFELTPQGVRRTGPLAPAVGAEPVDDEAPAGHARLEPKWVTAATATALLVAVGGWWVVHGRGPSLDPRRVLVAPFENRTGDAALGPLGEMAEDWVTQGLTDTGVAEVVDGSSARVMARQAAVDGNAGDVRSFARAVGAGMVVTGRYYLQGDSIELVARVIDGRSGQVLWEFQPLTASRLNQIAAAPRLRHAVAGELAVLLDESLAHFEALDARPPSYDAYREFLQGLTDYLEADHLEAGRHFSQAFARDTGFHLALLWAAQAATLGGYRPRERPFQRGDSLLALLGSARDALSLAEQDQLDYVLALRRSDLRAAYTAARLRRRDVRGDDAVRELALSAARIGRFHESLELLRSLNPDMGLLRGDPAHRSSIAEVQHALGDFRGQLKTTAELDERFPGSWDVPALKLQALAGLGRTRELDSLAFDLADRVTRDPDAMHVPDFGRLYYRGATVPLDLAARELLAHGHSADASALVRSALEWCARRSAAERAEAGFRLGWAHLLGQADRWRDADSVLAGVQPTSDMQATLQMYRGVIAAKLGDRRRALAASTALEKLPARDFISALHDPPAVPFRRAVIAAALGDSEEALRLLQQWKKAGDWAPLRLHSEPVLVPLFTDPRFGRLLTEE